MAYIFKNNQLRGTVHVPPSKSYAHRAIICASLAQGRSIIHNIDYNDDNTVSMVTLIPENPTYRPIRYMGHTLDSVRILGKVIAGQYRLR